MAASTARLTLAVSASTSRRALSSRRAVPVALTPCTVRVLRTAAASVVVSARKADAPVAAVLAKLQYAGGDKGWLPDPFPFLTQMVSSSCVSGKVLVCFP